MVSGDLLHFRGELLDLPPVLFDGCGHVQGQQVSRRIERMPI